MARQGPRVATSIPAVLIDSKGGKHAVEVVDLSNAGFGLRTGGIGLTPGERVQLRVKRYGDFPAEIEWASKREAGGRFLEPVPVPL